MAAFESHKIASNKIFRGDIIKYKFKSSSLGGTWAQFNVFIPQESNTKKVPVLFYLPGLTCNEDTGPWKGGFIRDAAETGIALIFPDTSPRGAGVEGEDDAWDFGTGAGFYLNATNPKYSKFYNMYTHVTKEIPSVIEALGLPIDLTRQSIFGHSMGGHGALVLYLRTLGQYRSVSAFSPIANPVKAPWGEKAFKGYLKAELEEGKEWDATELLSSAKGKDIHILVDVGDKDQFYLSKQLLPENLISAAAAAGFDAEQVKVHLHEGYDHSYYFISTFAPKHIKYHAAFLWA